jgi:large repetitive protein
MRTTPVRRSPLVSILALGLAGLLIGVSIAVVPKGSASSTGISTEAPNPAAAAPVTAEALAIVRGSIKKPKVSPSVPVRGEVFTVSGRVATKAARPVTLQRQSGSKWVTVAKSTTSSRGVFAFRVTTASSVVRYRVRASKATVGHKRYATATSRSVLVRTVGLNPTSPMAGERFAVSYSLTKAQVKKTRSVLIQRKSGRSWVTVGSGQVALLGKVTATAALSATSTVRVYVPKAKIKKRNYRAATSASFVVSVAPQSITLVLPSSGTVGQAMDCVVTAAPLRAGRTITIQQLSGATWTDVVSGAQIGTRTTLNVSATVAGTVSYRAVLAAYGGASAAASAPVGVTVQDAGPGAPVIAISSLSLGVSGTSYDTVLTSSGGTGDVTWSAAGLPAGLSLSPAGVLSGTPSESGTFDVTFTATDSLGKSASKTIALKINPSVSVATAALADGIVGSDYLLALEATGGMAPFAWSAEGLPTGLAIEGEDTITGQPTATGTSEVHLMVTDSNGKTATATLNLVVVNPITITTNALANGEVGDDYSQSLAASGGAGTYTWEVTSGSLPAGLTLSSAGAISGVPTAVSADPFTVKATDAAGRYSSAELTITVTGLQATTTSLAEGTVGQAYTQALAATGGDGSYAWSVTSGTLPDGLTLSGDGTISGTPTASSSGAVTFTVTDGKSRTASATLTLRVVGVVQVSTTALTGGIVGDDYALTLAAAGGSGSYTWQATGLPEGIELSGNQLVGVPVAEGSASVELTVTDGTGRTASATLSLAVGPAVSATTSVLPYALTSSVYAATLAAGGGTAPYTWAAKGLPTGIALNSETGVLSGTPADAEAGTTSSIELTVTDAHHKTATTAVLLAVRAPVSVTTSSVPEGTVGVAYSQSLAATGGLAPYSWSALSGLPAGMDISAGGVLSGTPTVAGDAEIEVKATDTSDPSLASVLQVLLSVKEPAGIVTAAVAEATVAEAYDQNLVASGGTAPYTWTLAAGTLPDGLSLSAGGKLAGTPTATGAANVELKVTDDRGREATKSITVTVKDPVTVATTSLDEGTVGVAYEATLTAAGGTAPFAWSAEAALPDGLALSAGGTLSGAPTAATNGASIKVKVTDSVGRTSSKTLTLKVSGPLLLVTTSLPGGVVGDSYSVSLEGAGGSGSYSWVVAGLPSGIERTGAELAGTPTAAGTYQVEVSISDEGGRTVADSFTLMVGPAVSVATTSLPHAVTTVGYGATLVAQGGTESYTWSAEGLPVGLELKPGTGEITGVPADAAGNTTASVVVTVKDSHNKTATATLSLDVLVPVAVVESTLPEATVGAAYDVTLTPGGGVGPYTWSTTSTLPDGISLSGAGKFSGTPTAPGSYDLIVNVVDSSDPLLSGSATFTLKVVDAVAISTTALPAGTVGSAYEQTLAATGGTSPLTWSLTEGSLPAGVSLSAVGVISGAPALAADSVVTVKVTDHVGRMATADLTIVVKDPVSITTSSLPDGTVTAAYSQTLAATGGDGAYTWTITSAALPAGLSLAADGKISGTPSAEESRTFTVKAADATGRSATAELTLSVATPVVIGTTSLASGLVGEAYGQTLSASGGVSPYTWQVTGLPGGLSVDPATGEITGTPSESGAFTFSITVTDTKSRTATTEIAVNMTAAVAITTASLADAVAQTDYSQTVAASGGTAPYQWAATGLPTGLSINADTGVVSGKTLVTKSSTVTVTVTDAHTKTSTRELTIWVEGVEALSAGDYHTCALLSSGGVKCWGLNDHGQLGNGTTTNSSVPVPVTGLSSGVTQVSASTGSSTCALLTTGAVKCWGWNAGGEIGDGTTTDRLTPTQVSGLTSGVTSVSVGVNSTCALVSGAVKCWGNNSHGGLGDNSTTTRLTPVQVSGLTSNVTAISTGYQYACAVLTTGAVKCWGEGDSGRLGDGYTSDRWTPVQVSGLTSGVSTVRTRSNHTCAVLTTGAAKCWGLGANGQLGDGASTDRLTPVQVSGMSSGVTAITSGRFHTCGMQSGAVKCWGGNSLGQLGDSTSTARSTPAQVTGLTSGVTGVAAGYQHSCAAVEGQAYCWGLNTSGQLGIGSLTQYNTPQKVHLFS